MLGPSNSSPRRIKQGDLRDRRFESTDRSFQAADGCGKCFSTVSWKASGDLGDECVGVVDGVADFSAEEFLIEAACWGEQSDFSAFIFDRDPTGGGDEQEVRAFAIEVELDEGTGIDGVVDVEVGELEIGEESDGVGGFIDLLGLTGGEVGGFQAAGVIFALRLAAGISGGGVGIAGSLAEAIQAVVQVFADAIKEGGFRTHTYGGESLRDPAAEARSRRDEDLRLQEL